MQDPSPRSGLHSAAWVTLFSALVLSGVAGIINQVVWQRALKIFLGGSETLSAMVVVLVFMLGLGLGAAVGGRYAERLRRPLLALAAVELSLVVVNTLVALLLGLDISETIYAVERVAVSFGMPLRLLYAIGSGLILLGPTMLMGATVPLASEGCQRQLHATSSRLVPVIFFVNTFGAAAGAFGASFWLLPYYGQRLALLGAVSCNLLASTLVAAGSFRLAGAEPTPSEPVTSARPGGLSHEEWLGAVLGFLSLGYEMYLFRLLALAHEPLPYTFAIGLCFFLLFWSVGVALAGKLKAHISLLAVITMVVTAAMPWVYQTDRFDVGFDLFWGGLLYFVPCLGFGLLYGVIVARASKRWGRDVGRFYAFNTVGSCSGILFFTLVGYEIPHDLNAWIISLGLLAIAGVELALSLRGASSKAALGLGLVGVLGALGLLASGLATPYTEANGERAYWGRDGVVEVIPSGEVYIDGLWHTKLSDGTNHIGRPYSWVMATAAVLAHNGSPVRDALVIGAGVGVSSVTLAGVEGIEVDGYEINHTLRKLLRDYPEETLHATERDNVTWIWNDARTGLALNEKQYDIILSAPLHLRQAGSSLLLSKEYMRLAKNRLKPDGVFALYSNEGVTEQSWLVQRTVNELYAYTETWYDGIVTVASDQPITFTPALIEARMAEHDRLASEMRWLDARLDGGVWGLYDQERLFPEVADRPISDDHPLVEYPEIAAKLVQPVPVESVRP